jgi:hypothetical protein
MERSEETTGDRVESRPAGGITVAEIWTFRVESGAGDLDLTGYKVEATDGGIGKIDEATYEVGRSYLVVDTGPWIFGRKVMLPAGVIERVDPDSKTVWVGRTRDEVKDSPEFDADRHREDDEYRRRLAEYYGR